MFINHGGHVMLLAASLIGLLIILINMRIDAFDRSPELLHQENQGKKTPLVQVVISMSILRI